MNTVRVRFAPSPTGYLHLGGLRTALYDFLFARAQGGTCILRIEDTDQSREVPGAMENLIKVLHELGIDFDESPVKGGDSGPYIQSQRLELYHQIAEQLVASGHAYPCFCDAETLSHMREAQQVKGEFVKYDRRCTHLDPSEAQDRIAAGEKHVIRLRMPDDYKFCFTDIIRGHVEMDSSQSDDQVLIKSDGFPTYHLAATVDDHFMQISHVIRGEEWLSSTPKHLWLYHCLGWEPPQWVHLPLILNPDRSKLSKRMNDVSVESYLAKGYLKEALLNFVALLGWHTADDRELYTLDELCSVFSLERVNKAGAVFDLTKLDWMNGQYLRSLPLETIAERAEPYFKKAGLAVPSHQSYMLAIETARQRCTLLPEIVDYCQTFFQIPVLDEAGITALSTPEAQTVLRWMLQQLPDTELSAEELDVLVKKAQAETGIKGKGFYTPLRLALLGKPHGPDLPSTFAILGITTVRERITKHLQA